MDLEKELWEVLERILHEDFPNHQRADCPRYQELLELAEAHGQRSPTRVLAHIRQCAPCFDKLKELYSKKRDRSCLPI